MPMARSESFFSEYRENYRAFRQAADPRVNGLRNLSLASLIGITLADIVVTVAGQHPLGLTYLDDGIIGMTGFNLLLRTGLAKDAWKKTTGDRQMRRSGGR